MLSTSHQVTAKSFWQQHGANITSEGKEHSEHLTPRSTALWEMDVGAKWDRPKQGEVFFPIMVWVPQRCWLLHYLNLMSECNMAFHCTPLRWLCWSELLCYVFPMVRTVIHNNHYPTDEYEDIFWQLMHQHHRRLSFVTLTQSHSWNVKWMQGSACEAKLCDNTDQLVFAAYRSNASKMFSWLRKRYFVSVW